MEAINQLYLSNILIIRNTLCINYYKKQAL